jgi:hypothetical protein
MKFRGAYVAFVPLMMLASQPALAADTQAGTGLRQTAAFAGLSVRMGLGERSTTPVARLKLSLDQVQGGTLSGWQRVNGQSLELGFSRKGKTELYFAGQSLSGLQQRFGIAPLTAVVVGIGALGVGAVAVSELADDEPRCMIERELCQGPGPGF